MVTASMADFALVRPDHSLPNPANLASKVRRPDDVPLLGPEVELPLLGVVPFDEELAAAERSGRAPIDAAPSSPAVAAVERLAATLEQVVANGRQT